MLPTCANARAQQKSEGEIDTLLLNQISFCKLYEKRARVGGSTTVTVRTSTCCSTLSPPTTFTITLVIYIWPSQKSQHCLCTARKQNVYTLRMHQQSLSSFSACSKTNQKESIWCNRTHSNERRHSSESPVASARNVKACPCKDAIFCASACGWWDCKCVRIGVVTSITPEITFQWCGRTKNVNDKSPPCYPLKATSILPMIFESNTSFFQNFVLNIFCKANCLQIMGRNSLWCANTVLSSI